MPDIFMIGAFALTTFYKQSVRLDFYHIQYIPLIVLLVYYIALRSK
jgi:hypothetical protein